MRIFIPSKGRAKTISTHKLLGRDFDWTVVVHTKEEYNAYLKTVPAKNLVISYAPFGINNQRNFIKKKLVKDGEWFLMMDDNIEGFNVIPDQWYAMPSNDFREMTVGRPKFRKQLEATSSFFTVHRRLHEDIKEAERLKTTLIGYAKTPNLYFRCRKYRTVGMVCTKMALIKKDDIRWRKDFKIVDDYPYTAAVLYRYGRILLNNYIYPIAGHQESGGIGTVDERTDRKIIECKEIVRQYNGLFRLHTRKGQPEGSDIRCRFTSEKQVEKWRQETNEAKIVYTF